MNWIDSFIAFVIGFFLSSTSTSFSIILFLLFLQDSVPEIQYAYLLGLLLGEGLGDKYLFSTGLGIIREKVEKIEEKLEEICERLKRLEKNK